MNNNINFLNKKFYYISKKKYLSNNLLNKEKTL